MTADTIKPLRDLSLISGRSWTNISQVKIKQNMIRNHLNIHQRVMLYILAWISYIPEQYDAPLRYPPNLYLLMMSLFSCLVFWWSACTQRPTVAPGLIHESERQRGERQRSLHRTERAVSSALTPEGCVWAAHRHSGARGPRLLPPPLLWMWPFTKLVLLPKQPQMGLQLSTATG